MNFNYFIPTRILFGCGELDNLHKQQMPGKKALIVISNGNSTRANGYLERTQQQLEQAGVGCAVYDGIEPNPTVQNVMDGAEAAKRHSCDFIVGLGGGSSIDASKVIAMLATNEGDYWDYIGVGTGKGMEIQNDPLPIVAITTTAGTGTEADPWGVVTNPETKEKVGFGYDKTFPVLSVVDPELMVSVPPAFTAYQGFDALLQATEGYIANVASLMSDMMAITAIENVGRYLACAVKDGSDMAARGKVAFGNTLSGIMMCVGSTTSEHSLEHAMSAFHPDLPHGAGLIMISEAYYTHFIKKGVCPERFVQMAKAMGKEDAAEPMDFIAKLVDLQKACDVYGLKMSDYGMEKGELRKLAQNAKETMGGLFESDRVQLTEDDCVAIYEASYR